jgi:hypothetical protein
MRKIAHEQEIGQAPPAFENEMLKDASSLYN